MVASEDVWDAQRQREIAAGAVSLWSRKAADVNPEEYLADMLACVQLWPADRLDDLLPANWQLLKNNGQLPPINS